MSKSKHFFASLVALFLVAGVSVGLAVAGTRAPDRQASARSATRSAAGPCADYPPVQLYSSEDDGYAYPTYVATDGRNTFYQAYEVTPYTGWANPISPSTWVSWTPNRASQQPFPYTYYYRVSVFALPPPDPSRTFTLTGQVLSDNHTDVQINGTTYASQPGGSPTSNFGGPPYSFTIPNVRSNTRGESIIDFQVTDTSGPVTGLDYSMTMTCVPTPPSPAQICVSKFDDTNGNGAQDSGESNLSGWTFTVKDSGGNTVGTLTSAGKPVCLTVKPGTYSVTETQQTGWVAINPSSGTQTVTVAAGQTQTVKFANQQLGRLCAVKYSDKNGNGSQDSGEPTLSGWTFTVKDSAGNTVGTLTSAANPVCMAVKPGTYSVTETQQTGWVATNPSSGTQTVTVAEGQTQTVKFGNQQISQICVEKYWDKNGNGTQNPGEPFLSGWSFTVNTSPLTQIVIGKGKPCERVRAGTYTVTETQKPGWIPTDPTSGGRTVTITAGQTTTLKFGNYQPLLDHYECYWTSPHTFPNRLVGVRDQFNGSPAPRNLVVTREGLDTLCNPASKNQERVPNPRAHLFCYPVAKGTPFVPKTVMTTNQFGQLVLRIVRPTELCLPTAKTLRPQVEIQRIPTLDHYLCYDIRQVGVRRYPTVLLVDEFGVRRAAVLVADRLCAPAQKFVQGQKPSVRVDPVDHLVCYTIRMPFEPRAAYIRNQFEYRPVRVIRGRWLCVPSIKKVLRIEHPIPDCKSNLKTYVETDGRADNFQTSDGPEPATPPAMYDQTAVNTDFKQEFSVPKLVDRMCSVTIEFRAKGLGELVDNDAASLSSTYLTSTESWSQYFGGAPTLPSCCSSPVPTYRAANKSVGSGPAVTNPPPLGAGSWLAGSVKTFTWTFGPAGGLPPGYPFPTGNPNGNTGAGVFTNFNLSGILDLGVEDDTAVDYAKLTIVYE